MKRYKWSDFLWVCACLLLISCYDDQGNYNYNWVQDVFLKDELRDTMIERGTLLTLTPELYRTLEYGSEQLEPVDPDDYTYSWATGTGAVFSNNKDLNDTIWWATGSSAQVTYKITEKKSGVSWLYKFNLKVIQQLDKGLLFMTEDDNKQVELEIYASDAKGNKVHQTGILARSGFLYSGGGANCVANIESGYSSLSRNKYLLVSTGEGTGWLKLPDFTWNSKQMLDLLMVKQEPNRFVVRSAFQLSNAASFYFTADGGAYVHNTFNIIYTDFAYLNKVKFKAAPYIGGNNYAAILYNEDKQCFVTILPGSTGFDYPPSYCSSVAENLAYEGSNLIYMQQISGNNIVALLKDKEGKYRKLTYRFVGPPMNMMLNGSSSDLTADIAMMEDAEWKAIDFNLKYIYFVKDGRLYNYREGAGINACEYAKILFDGEEVALDEVVSLNVITNGSTGGDYRNVLFVATWSEENKGRVYVVKPENMESRNLIVQEVIEVDGKVKSVCNWSN